VIFLRSSKSILKSEDFKSSMFNESKIQAGLTSSRKGTGKAMLNVRFLNNRDHRSSEVLQRGWYYKGVVVSEVEIDIKYTTTFVEVLYRSSSKRSRP